MRSCTALIFLYLVGTFGQLDDVDKAMNEFTETSDPDYEMTKQIEIFEEGVLAKLRPEIQPRMRELFNEMRTLNEDEVRSRFESRFEPEERAEVGKTIASAISHELKDLIESINAKSEGLNPGPLEVIKEGLKRLQDQLSKIFGTPSDNLGPQGLTDGWESNSLHQKTTNTTRNPPLNEPFKTEPMGDTGDPESPQNQKPEEDKTEDEDEELTEEEGEEVEEEGDEDSDEDNEEDDGEEDREYQDDDEGEDESDEEDGEIYDEDGEDGNESDEDEYEEDGRGRHSRDKDNTRDEL